MEWAAGLGSGALIVVGWILTARILIRLDDKLDSLRERISFLEAKVNGMKKE